MPVETPEPEPAPVEVAPEAPAPEPAPVDTAESVQADAEPVVVGQPGSTTEGGVLPTPALKIVVPGVGREVDEEGNVNTPRDDDDVRVGGFATITDGEFAGRYVVYQRTVTSGADGYPDTVLVKTRDDRDEPLIVDYASLRPAPAGGR